MLFHLFSGKFPLLRHVKLNNTSIQWHDIYQYNFEKIIDMKGWPAKKENAHDACICCGVVCQHSTHIMTRHGNSVRAHPCISEALTVVTACCQQTIHRRCWQLDSTMRIHRIANPAFGIQQCFFCQEYYCLRCGYCPCHTGRRSKCARLR